MRTEGQIKHKLKQAQYRHLKRALRKRFGSAGGVWPEPEVQAFKARMREFFSTASIPEVAQDFPDVAALMWVLEQREDSLMPGATLVGKMGGVMLWADTYDDAEEARVMIDKIVEAATREPEPTSTEEPVKRSWWQRLFG